MDKDRLDPTICGDLDADGCDDCVNSANNFSRDDINPDVSNDGVDYDEDGKCDDNGIADGQPGALLDDPDDDNDGVVDEEDQCDPDLGDLFSDDGAPQGQMTSEKNWESGQSTDNDGDGCRDDLEDEDDDNDGILDSADVVDGVDRSKDPTVCGDSDGDNCDDCSQTTPGNFTAGANFTTATIDGVLRVTNDCIDRDGETITASTGNC